jgi:hypothetical protein
MHPVGNRVYHDLLEGGGHGHGAGGVMRERERERERGKPFFSERFVQSSYCGEGLGFEEEVRVC